MIDVSSCPICNSTEWQSVFTVQDHSISRERFRIKECVKCSLRATSPRPEDADLSAYYESDNYISHSGKANSLINRVYLFARNYSLNWKLKLVNSISNKGSVLDVGCGTGEFLQKVKADNWKISGIEPNQTARQKAVQLTSTAIHESFQELTSQFDLITLWHVLEHLPNLDENFRHISDRLKESGKLLIAVPNHRSRDEAKYKELWAAYDVPRHLWHFNQTSMVLLLQKYGFKLVQTIPMKLDSFYVSMLSEKYKASTSALQNAINGFLSGLASNANAKKTGEYSSLVYIAKK